MRRFRAAAVVGASIMAGGVAASGLAPLALQMLLRMQQTQVDALQRRLDGTADYGMRLHLDGVQQMSPGTTIAWGWAVVCTAPTDEHVRIVAVVDGLQSGNGYGRQPRPDVLAALGSWCASLPAWPGVSVLIDLSPFEPGWNGDRRHSVQLRIYDEAGHMAESNVLWITTS